MSSEITMNARMPRVPLARFILLFASLAAAGSCPPALAAEAVQAPAGPERSGAVMVSGAAPQAAAAVPASAAFTYQGVLNAGGVPLNGSCDLQFSLWDDAAAGTQIGATQTITTTVSAGLVNVVLNDPVIGSTAMDGTALWLEIAVRTPSGSGAYTVLSPRQAITPAPLASGLRPGATMNSTASASAQYKGSLVINAPQAPSGRPMGVEAHAGGTTYVSVSFGDPIGVWGDSHSGLGVVGTSADRAGIYGLTQTGHAIEGSAGVGGYSGFFNTRVYVGGNIESPRFRTSMVINSTGPLPITSGSFTTGGGTLMLTYSGSGYLAALPQKLIGMTVKIDGVFVDNTGIFANQAGMHLAFVSKSWILTGIAAGIHTIELSGLNGVTTDFNDIFNVSVTELPF
jgi:hypothetical protein